MSGTLSYRPEIDGLRAVAVILVLLFHADIPGFSKGYIGVDIFFVISGYLITSIITKQQETGKFSYLKFMKRRIRRILPALMVVMLCCIPFAYWLMLPDPLENFGQSLIATTFSANNILLLLTTGYWDVSSDFKPLMHTWSLGVEEQFYIVYPLVLTIAIKLRSWLSYTLLSILAVISFSLMLKSQNTNPDAAFYLLHFRAWQLLVGGIAGLVAFRHDIKSMPWLAAVGMLLIIASLINWPSVEHGMSVTLILATVGSALYLFWSNSHSLVTWVLVRRPFVFVGLISYSLYLWHQPIFAFIRIYKFEIPDRSMFLLGMILSLVLAIISWHFVEKPFRLVNRVGKKKFTSFICVSILLLLSSGWIFYSSAGLPGRMGYAAAEFKAGATISYNERVRRLLPKNIPEGVKSSPVVVVAGNSFARDFSNVLLEAGLGNKLTLIYRDDLGLCPRSWSQEQKLLVEMTDMLIFASGRYSDKCVKQIATSLGANDVVIKYVGPKNFGYNLNPLVRFTAEERSIQRLKIPNETLLVNAKQLNMLGARYLDLIDLFSDDQQTTRVADDHGTLLTTDTIHLSRAGAMFVANKLKDMMPEIYEIAD